MLTSGGEKHKIVYYRFKQIAITGFNAIKLLVPFIEGTVKH